MRIKSKKGGPDTVCPASPSDFSRGEYRLVKEAQNPHLHVESSEGHEITCEPCGVHCSDPLCEINKMSEPDSQLCKHPTCIWSNHTGKTMEVK